MIIYFTLDDDGYLDGWGSVRSSDIDTKLEVEEEHEVLRNPHAFKYVDGELIKDEVKQKELIEQYEKEQNKLKDKDMTALAILELAEEIEKMKGMK